ncbi:hypothetical protein DFA_07432 [Cavenderia fasciculata]|uniref:ATPase domain-containing protein n=1 Tax=Cavenderia fasciculata TaxID=261658 RepID=F4PWE5_CACFS|nr:uncharacterized protein DFA_07432 [Cavenderia fasciculata]EGG20309.1 hypothetical protein DFA_07432 [Cavenderia fasciculata]|eukprot:XP_004367292.1 hypothetical protein DFA_07432 [Cavenderia fasciculata]
MIRLIGSKSTSIIQRSLSLSSSSAALLTNTSNHASTTNSVEQQQQQQRYYSITNQSSKSVTRIFDDQHTQNKMKKIMIVRSLNKNNLEEEEEFTTVESDIAHQFDPSIVGKRHFTSWGMRFILGFMIVGVMFFARRWTPRQISRIIDTLKKGETVDPYLLNINNQIPREKEEAYLSSFLASAPVGPVCIVGPDGCGKSHILKRIVSSRKLSVIVDMRQNAVMSGDELLVSFLKSLGYLLPSSDPISSVFMKQDKKQKINVQEIIQGLETIYLSLVKIKEDYEDIPLIVINNIEALPTSENFTRFIDWCISVTDNKLANIVFLTSSQFVHFHLDSNYSFKKRRFLFNIPYPPTDVISQYLHNVFTSDGKDHKFIYGGGGGSKNRSVLSNPVLPLAKEDVDDIIQTFGSQMRDIDAIVGLIFKGESYDYVSELFISETTQKISSLVDSMFQKANLIDNDSEKKNIFEKYQRFWKMLEILTEKPNIAASKLIEEVFHEQPEELDEYFKSNIVYYWMRQSEIMPEIELSTVDRTYDIFVTFSSPRIQNAVKRVLVDHRFELQRNSIDKFFKKHDLKDEKKDLEEERTEKLQEYEKVYTRLENLIENSTQWIKYMGQEKFDERRVYFVTKEDDCLKKIDHLTLQIEKIDKELDDL